MRTKNPLKNVRQNSQESAVWYKNYLTTVARETSRPTIIAKTKCRNELLKLLDQPEESSKKFDYEKAGCPRAVVSLRARIAYEMRGIEIKYSDSENLGYLTPQRTRMESNGKNIRELHKEKRAAKNCRNSQEHAGNLKDSKAGKKQAGTPNKARKQTMILSKQMPSGSA